MKRKKEMEALRAAMVEEQVRRRGVKDDRVLEALRKVPREIFVPWSERSRSYEDGPLPIGCGQTISQPYIVGYMTELLELEGSERVLEIGTGSGYQTAILAETAAHVYTVECIEKLGRKAEMCLREDLHYRNISFKIGNGREGWEEYAPFDCIMLTAAPETFPQSLFSQLKENGIAVAPVGYGIQSMMRYRKLKNKIKEDSLIGVSFVRCV